MRRHESLLYWLDSDWLQIFIILVALLVFDLVDQRCAACSRLLLFGAAGSLIGFLVQLALTVGGG